jgi:NADH-quinone oxidoreductase subunit C
MENTGLQLENSLAQALNQAFTRLEATVKRKARVEVKIDKEIIPSTLLFAKEKLGYVHFSHMSCVDWIEDNVFEVVYILWNPIDKINLLIKSTTARENASLPNIDYIWRQANTYEREIREMFGIDFPGLVGEHDFILEDWQDMPPMRRDFDTVKYVDEHFFTRPGREDAKDVREQVAERSGEDIPEFAKKYSRK